MRDQAETLRLKMLKRQGELGKTIAVVSGKGGVGKSNFSMNFAINLASKDKKVAIVDMDIGMGNINILIGKNVSYSLKDYLEGNKSLDEVIFEGTTWFTMYCWWLWHVECAGMVGGNV